MSFFLAHGPAYQHPRKVHFLDVPPLQGTGKVDTPRLKELASKSVEGLTTPF